MVMTPEQLAIAEELDDVDEELETALMEWRDAGAPVSLVVAAIADMVDARVRFALSTYR